MRVAAGPAAEQPGDADRNTLGINARYGRPVALNSLLAQAATSPAHGRDHSFAAVSTVFVCNLNAMLGDYLCLLRIDRKDIYS
jgi:hypothetical protein